MKRLPCIFLGAGGHASVLMEILFAQGLRPVGALDSNPDVWGLSFCGVRILGGDRLLPSLVKKGLKHFVVGIGSTGDHSRRRKLFEFGISCRLAPLTLVHPTAVISGSARIGRGCQLLPRSVVNAGAILGENVIVNTGAIVEHDCEIGDHAHLATAAALAGGVFVGRGTHIGLGATVLQNLRIGSLATVGAGAVVIRNVEPKSTVGGVPARALHKRNPR
jgi:sugar O-acyltransferase (sialic acid O-acetyltransferase NeuD family)